MSGAIFLLQTDVNALAMEWFNGIASVIYRLVCVNTLLYLLSFNNFGKVYKRHISCRKNQLLENYWPPNIFSFKDSTKPKNSVVIDLHKSP